MITGIIRQRWKPLSRDIQCEVRMIVVGLSVRLVSDKDNDRFLTEGNHSFHNEITNRINSAV